MNTSRNLQDNTEFIQYFFVFFLIHLLVKLYSTQNVPTVKAKCSVFFSFAHMFLPNILHENLNFRSLIGFCKRLFLLNLECFPVSGTPNILLG